MEALKKSLIVIISGYFSVVLLAVTDPRVRVEMAGIGIEADHLSMKDSLAHVLGNVRLTGENFYARCEDLEYDICTKDIHANALDIAMERGYASAEEAFFSSERITLKNADIGLNAGGGGMVPHLKTEHMEYDRRKRKGMARSARIKIGEIPLIIPSVTVGDWVRFVGLRFDGGHSKKLGGYIQSEMTYNIYEDLHWGLLWDVYTKRGVLIGPVVKVDSEGELICSHLDLRTGYICDRGERGADIDGVAIEKKRWYIDGKQHHHLWERVDILSDFLWASDGQIGKDFYSNDDADIRDSFGELDYRGENDLWTLFSRVKMNRYQHFPQQIPSIRWERFPQEIFDSGIYYFGYIDFTRQKFTQEGPEHPGQWEAVEQNRIDIYWGINRPTELGCGINFTPLLGGRWTHYCGDCDRFLGELGFDWGADFYAFYPSTFPWLMGQEWKHVLRPIVKYRYWVRRGKGRPFGVIDGKVENNFLPMLDLAEARNGDDLEGQSILRLGLENDFFTKGKRIRKFAALDFYQDLHFKRNFAGKREKMLSDFYILSELNPRRWLNLRLYSRLNWEHFSLNETNAEVNFLSGDLWELGFRAKFLRHRATQFGIHFSFHFDAISQLDLLAQIDGRRGKFLAMEVGYRTRLGSVWDVEIFCKIKNRSSREGRFCPGFLINLARW